LYVSLVPNLSLKNNGHQRASTGEKRARGSGDRRYRPNPPTTRRPHGDAKGTGGTGWRWRWRRRRAGRGSPPIANRRQINRANSIISQCSAPVHGVPGASTYLPRDREQRPPCAAFAPKHLPLHIPEPLSMTRAAMSSSSAMVVQGVV
jgi:hypothetical protein